MFGTVMVSGTPIKKYQQTAFQIPNNQSTSPISKTDTCRAPKKVHRSSSTRRATNPFHIFLQMSKHREGEREEKV